MFAPALLSHGEDVHLRKYLIGMLAAVAALAFGAVAVAQTADPSHSLNAKITPAKAGKPGKSKAAKMAFTVTNNPNDGTTAKAVEVFFSKGTKVNTAGFPVCSHDTLSQQRDPSVCPKGSNLGKGTAKANLFGGPISFDLTLFAGGKNTIIVWLDQVGGDIDLPLEGKITKASGKFGQRLHIEIPREVFSPAGSCCAQLNEIKATLGATFKKGKKTFRALETTGCPPQKKWTIGSKLLYVMPTDIATVSPVPTKSESSQETASPCKK